MTLRVSLTTKTVGGAGGPDMDEVPWTAPEVLQPAFGADDRATAPVVGCEVALLVGGERPVVQLHLHHGQVFHVQVRIQPALLCRGPAPQGELVAHPQIRVVPPVLDVSVDGQRAHPGDLGAISPGQPVDHVDVVGALLQQQGLGVAAFGMPVLEVVVPAVADKMPAPHGFHLTDGTRVDHLLHLPDHRHMAHVVAYVQHGAGALRSGQDVISRFQRDVQRLFHERGNSCLQRADNHVVVREVGGQ